MFSIIQAKPDDLSEIYTMIFELANYEGIYDKIKITVPLLNDLLFCETPIHFAALAKIEHRTVGFVMYNMTYHNICVNVTPGIYIENLFVLSEYRNQGVGSALLRHVAMVAKNKNASRIEWWVSKDNQKAQYFYERFDIEHLNDWTVYKAGTMSINQLLSQK